MALQADAAWSCRAGSVYTGAEDFSAGMVLLKCSYSVATLFAFLMK